MRIVFMDSPGFPMMCYADGCLRDGHAGMAPPARRCLLKSAAPIVLSSQLWRSLPVHLGQAHVGHMVECGMRATTSVFVLF